MFLSYDSAVSLGTQLLGRGVLFQAPGHCAAGNGCLRKELKRVRALELEPLLGLDVSHESGEAIRWRKRYPEIGGLPGLQVLKLSSS